MCVFGLRNIHNPQALCELDAQPTHNLAIYLKQRRTIMRPMCLLCLRAYAICTEMVITDVIVTQKFHRRSKKETKITENYVKNCIRNILALVLGQLCATQLAKLARCVWSFDELGCMFYILGMLNDIAMWKKCACLQNWTTYSTLVLHLNAIGAPYKRGRTLCARLRFHMKACLIFVCFYAWNAAVTGTISTVAKGACIWLSYEHVFCACSNSA